MSHMGYVRNSIDRYEIIKIGLAVLFIAALKVWGSMKSWPLTVLTFSVPILLYLSVNGIQRYYHWKALRESRIDVIDTMSGMEFEEFLLAHYRNLGYKGKTTPKTGDYGADLVLEKDNRRIVVQAKRWKNVVGIEAVQQVIGSIKYYGAVKGMVITNGVFTENACDLARVNGIELIDREKLIEMMRKSRGGKTYLWAPLKEAGLRKIKCSVSFLMKTARFVVGFWLRGKENMVRLLGAPGSLDAALRGRLEGGLPASVMSYLSQKPFYRLVMRL